MTAFCRSSYRKTPASTPPDSKPTEKTSIPLRVQHQSRKLYNKTFGIG